MNAIATLIFLFSVITIFLSQWLMTRGEASASAMRETLLTQAAEAVQ
jgi:hypothetical protein